MRGIGEAWRPIPARLRAEVLVRRYSPTNHAPELEGWVWCWTLTEQGRPPSIRDTALWSGWGKTKAARVRAEVVKAFESWTGEKTQDEAGGTKRDQSREPNGTDDPHQEPIVAESPVPNGTPGGTKRDDRGRVLLETPTVTEEHLDPSPTLAVITTEQAMVAVRARVRQPPDLVPRLWDALMELYVGSSHGKLRLELDSGGRTETLGKCLKKLNPRDPLKAAQGMVHLLAFWLYGPNAFWRENREGSALIGTLLKPEKIGERFTESESWSWDMQVHESRAGPRPTSNTKQSNASRQIAELMRKIEEDERVNGIEKDHPEGDPEAPSIRLLQPAFGG